MLFFSLKLSLKQGQPIIFSVLLERKRARALKEFPFWSLDLSQADNIIGHEHRAPSLHRFPRQVGQGQTNCQESWTGKQESVAPAWKSHWAGMIQCIWAKGSLVGNTKPWSLLGAVRVGPYPLCYETVPSLQDRSHSWQVVGLGASWDLSGDLKTVQTRRSSHICNNGQK